ncbi:EamA family transporter RarD [Streptomyces sp. NPDC046215]|uniref:EamA family transporter RarD n=1 Tax=Streptomyces stramineus TaxID=173861 RepID=A0ABP3JHN2_9ACTN
MKPSPPARNETRTGLLCSFVAYSVWGLFPLYWPLLEPSGAVEILAHRMVWSFAVVALALAVTRRWGWIRPLLREPKRLGMVALGALFISLNWGVYIWGVNSGHVVETSMGYFINPLAIIAFGVLVLRERLRVLQWTAVGIGVLAVVVMAVAYGKPPWLALALAASFSTYSLVKKKVGLGGLESLAAEAAVQFLPALGFLLFLGARGESTFVSAGAGHALLLAATGLLSTVPLLCFGVAAVRLPLSVLGMLQYLAPVFQFALGLTVFHEPMPAERWAGFVLVWLALALLTWDALRTARISRTELRAARAKAAEQERADMPDTTGDVATLNPDVTIAPGTPEATAQGR